MYAFKLVYRPLGSFVPYEAMFYSFESALKAARFWEFATWEIVRIEDNKTLASKR